MEEERILERERYQIEQIRQLESEELQIEEVDDDDDESSEDDYRNGRGYGGASSSADYTFNTCLASLHTYLGEVKDTHNRLAFLDGGVVINLPLFYLEGVVLFPEAILPLRVIQPNFIAAVDRALRQVDAPYTIGVVRVYRDPDNGRVRFATTGTTAEIRQYRRLEDGSMNVVTRGQQRFHLRRRWIDAEGAPCGEVQIIQDLPLRTPQDAVGCNSIQMQTSLCDASQVRRYGFGGEDEHSDGMSEESFETALSSEERRLHHSALVSCHSHSVTDELTSSDDENFMPVLEFSLGTSLSNDSVDSPHPNNDGSGVFGMHSQGLMEEKNSDGGSVKASQRIGTNCVSGWQPCSRIGWRQNSLRRLREVPTAFWPPWVYRMYDSYYLAHKAADKWKQVVKAPSMDGLVKKPDLLSFHIASKIPLSESTRQELLEIDGISYRLRREIELLESFDRIHCKNCKKLIARRSDMLVMSSEGPLGAYVNPHGFVHEVMTLYEAYGLALIGDPEKEFSWFPGYAWTIADCATCECQMGWLFTAIKKKLKPRSFWGIRSSQVADDTR